MKIENLTNKFNLPAVVVNAVVYMLESYSKGDADFSVTGLLRPPFMHRLEIDNADRIIKDVADFFHVLNGIAWHALLETANKDKGFELEQRLFANVGGFKISGQVDMYDPSTGNILDYKTTSGNSLKINLPTKEDYVTQVNMYCYLLFANGKKVGNAHQILGIAKDWSPMTALRERDFPKCAFVCKPVKLANKQDVERNIIERAKCLTQAQQAPRPRDVPPCSLDDMWATRANFAVMKNAAAKRATKLHVDEYAANEHAERIGGIVVKRPERRARCLAYCDVSDFCPVWKAFKKDNNIDAQEG